MLHSSIKPIKRASATKHAYQSVFHDSIVVYYTAQDFAFKRHLLQFHNEAVFIAADPLFNFQWGVDLEYDPGDRSIYYTNTRGALLQGDIGKKVSFSSWFYENQAFFPEYLNDYILSKGELYYGSNNAYFRDNGVVPGQGRTKEFKVNGFDFAMAGGYVSITPLDWLNIQVGHDKHFIGHGYRSLFLSDNAFNYPFLKTDMVFGKFRYAFIHASMNELRRLPARTTPEALYYRKAASYFLLSWKPSPKLEFSLFEGVQWRTMNAQGSLPFNYWKLNPLPFLSSIALGFNTLNNAYAGIQAEYWMTNKIRIYGQFVTDDVTDFRWGMQAGGVVHDVLLRGLSVQLEYNQTTRYMYASSQPLQSISHFNLPLAHPLGAGFSEALVNIRYDHPKRVWGEAMINYYHAAKDTGSVNTGRDPLMPYVGNPIARPHSANVFSVRLEGGVRLNVKTNMQFLGGYQFRTESTPSGPELTQFFYVAWRTNLRNIYYDI